MTTAHQLIPEGAWTDSTAGFEIGHAAVGAFRGQFRKIEGGIVDRALRGEVSLDTLDVFDDNLKAHLLSPDPLDAERNPTLTFVASDVRSDGDGVTVEGDLTVRGVTRRVQATGSTNGPVDLGEHGGTRVGIGLETRIDRTDSRPRPERPALRRQPDAGGRGRALRPPRTGPAGGLAR